MLATTGSAATAAVTALALPAGASPVAAQAAVVRAPSTSR